MCHSPAGRLAEQWLLLCIGPQRPLLDARRASPFALGCIPLPKRKTAAGAEAPAAASCITDPISAAAEDGDADAGDTRAGHVDFLRGALRQVDNAACAVDTKKWAISDRQSAHERRQLAR